MRLSSREMILFGITAMIRNQGEGNGAPWSILRFRLSDWIKFLRREIMNNAFNWINSRDD